MRIIGIDPGMAIAGYCIMDVASGKEGAEYTLVSSGSIQTDKLNSTASRLLEIHRDIAEIIKAYKPDIASVEQLFYFKNAKTIVPVCEARGIILMTLEMYNVPIYEYTPLVVKQTITGYGRADKDDVKKMIEIILDSCELPKLDDAADAIAIAICHARQQDCECIKSLG